VKNTSAIVLLASLLCLFFVLVLTSAGVPQGPPTSPAKYKVLEDRSDLEKEINAASAAGYRVREITGLVAEGHPAGSLSSYGNWYWEQLLVVLEFSGESGRVDYRVARGDEPKQLAKSLNAAGAAGFRISPDRTVSLRDWGFGAGIHEYVTLMERSASESSTLQYQVLDTAAASFKDSLARAASEHYEVASYLPPGELVLEKGLPAGLNRRIGYTVLKDYDAATLGPRLNQAASQGFRLWFTVPSGTGRSLTVMMEKLPDVQRCEYRVEMGSKVPDLAKAVEGNSRSGYYLRAAGMTAVLTGPLRNLKGLVNPPNTAVVIMEKPGPDVLQREYLIREAHGIGSIRREFDAAGLEGLGLAGIASTVDRNMLLFSKSSGQSAAH